MYLFFIFEKHFNCKTKFKKIKQIKEIEWYQGTRRIDPSRERRFEIKSEMVDRKGTKSILVINDLLQNDFTNYSCRGINSHGLSSQAIRLDPKSKFN